MLVFIGGDFASMQNVEAVIQDGFHQGFKGYPVRPDRILT